MVRYVTLLILLSLLAFLLAPYITRVCKWAVKYIKQDWDKQLGPQESSQSGEETTDSDDK